MPAWDSNADSDERQLAVSGNTLDHTAIRAGSQFDGIKSLRIINYDKTWTELFHFVNPIVDISL